MEIREDILRRMMELNPDWYIRPYYFLEFIILTDFWCQMAVKVQPFGDLSLSPAGARLGEILHKELTIDIFPYKDFEDLRSRCALETNLELELHLIMSENIEDAIEGLLDGTGILCSPKTSETGRASNMLIDTIIRRIRPFIDLA